MSQVQQVQQNYSLTSGVQYTPHANQRFGISSEKLVRRATIKEINRQFDFSNKQGAEKVKYFFLWSGKKVHDFLAKNSGEKETQLLNAIFTCTLAPLMIWKNPFLKKDEDQKKYAALRQPISAVIAVSGGLAMTIGINNYLDKTLNDGYIRTLDGRTQPTASYIRNTFKKSLGAEFKQLDLNNQSAVSEFMKKHNLDDVDSDLYAKKPGNFITRFLQRHSVKAEILDTYDEAFKEERKNLIVSLTGENPDNLSLKKVGSDNIIYLKQDGKEVEIGKNIPNLENEEQFTKYLNENNLYRQKFINTMNGEGIEMYTDGVQKGLTKKSSKDVLNDKKAINFTDNFGLTGDETRFYNEEALKPEKIDEEVLGKMLLKINDKKVEGSMQEVHTEEIKAIEKSESRTTKILSGGIHEPKIRLMQLFDLVRTGKEDISKKISNLFDKDITEITNADAAKYFISKLNISDKTGKRQANLLDVARNLATNKITKLGKYKAYKGYVAIIFNLFATAVTCSALNWVYPRFIEKFFPELTTKKGGNK